MRTTSHARSRWTIAVACGLDAPSRATCGVEIVTDRHRYVPGLMFGGWGPHLGHLVRAEGTIHWVDGLCDQSVPGDCDVNVNRRVGVFRREARGWTCVSMLVGHVVRA